MVNEFFQHLEVKLKEHFIEAKTHHNDTIALANLTTNSIIVNLTTVSFSICNLKELRYSISLLKLYKSYVKPLLSKLRTKLTARAGNYNKLFFITGSVSDSYPGKSILNTRRSMDTFIHWSSSVIEIDEQNNVSVRHDGGLLGRLELISLPDVAHMSHFRKESIRFDQMDRIVPISSFHFDLNYLKCYLIPGIQSF
jgi:hypothetical protein